MQFYLWLQPWGDCSVGCGGGTRSRTMPCILGATLRPSNDAECLTFEGNPFPNGSLPSLTGRCNVQQCPVGLPMWRLGEWGACSQAPVVNSPGDIEEYPNGTYFQCGGLQTRTTTCVDPFGAPLDASVCVQSGLPTPADTQRCGRCSFCRPFHNLLDSGAPNSYDPVNTCSGHGQCATDGFSCNCNAGWFGAACQTFANCTVQGMCATAKWGSGWGSCSTVLCARRRLNGTAQVLSVMTVRHSRSCHSENPNRGVLVVSDCR